MQDEFFKMLDFAKLSMPYGFKKNKDAASVARVRFEALACGITLAQRIEPDLKRSVASVSRWIDSEEFRTHVVSDASNSLPRLRGRIEYVRDRLLEG